MLITSTKLMKMWLKTKNKFRARKMVIGDNIFDSKLEAERYLYLQEMVNKGVISNLARQVKFMLLPAQVEERAEWLKTKGKNACKVVERAVNYIADFVYIKNGEQVIEDTKGLRLPDYIIKRKLMRLRGTPIREINKATERV